MVRAFNVLSERFRNPVGIASAFVATHNHFAIERGGMVFKQSANVIKLQSGATDDDHLGLLRVAQLVGRLFLVPMGLPQQGRAGWR